MICRLLSLALFISLAAILGCNNATQDLQPKPRGPRAERTLVLNWSIANSGRGIGRTGWNIDEGWPTFIEDHVRPGIKWCEQSGVKPVILILHAFGQWDDVMHIDGWDFAKQENVAFLLEDFATDAGWKSITKDYDCYAYVGDIRLVDRLRDLPEAKLEEMVRRNLQPYADAGFKGIYVDCSENAITEPYVGITPRHSSEPSIDVLLLKVADEMFPERTGVEAAPRNFPPFKDLHSRNVIIRDPTFRHRFGGFTPEQDAKFVWHNETEKKTRRYGPRHSHAAALGWPNRDYLTGTVLRTLTYRDGPQMNMELARAIAAEGDVACVSPQLFIQEKIKASDLFPPIEPVL